MNLCCQQDDRRDAVRRLNGWNGLDYVEVSDDQRTLFVYFLGKLPPEFGRKEGALERYLRIEGGQRVRDIQITKVEPRVSEVPDRDDSLVVTLERFGDFSTYTLRLVGVANVDPHYESVEFSFKVGCPSDLDCAPPSNTDTPVTTEPEINYLAKDYAGFRQLLLDRLALLLPDWEERHLPDLGITLVELLAYVGDQLSYHQDAVGTEAYLDTARRRISVRRHARLVDYTLHEGCNARAWVCVQTDQDISLPVDGLAFVTMPSTAAGTGRTVLTQKDLTALPAQSFEVFEPLLPACSLKAPDEVLFRRSHGTIPFYTWGKSECCLVKGSKSATLLDTWATDAEPIETPDAGPGIPSTKTAANPVDNDEKRSSGASDPAPEDQCILGLAPGDVLIFEEVISPRTGLAADADPRHRHAVRLTRVTPGKDVVNLTVSGRPTPYVEVEWSEEDKLPFSLPISAIGPPAEGCGYWDGLSVARGNVLLVDHGRTIYLEKHEGDRPVVSQKLGEVGTLRTEGTCECAGHPGDLVTVPREFRATLAKLPLTHREPLPTPTRESPYIPAKRLLTQHVRSARPDVSIVGQPAESWKPAETWEPRRDLLDSGPADRHFAVEIDNEGRAHLRFGDGELGYQPPPGMTLSARYRVGNGLRGNVGAGMIALLVSGNTRLSGVSITVRNPLPATGGTEQEPMAEAKLFAPHRFRKRIERAITAEDYAQIARRDPWGQDDEPHPALQGTSAALVWTGSWNEAVVAIDPVGRQQTSDLLRKAIGQYLRQYRRMGHDLRVLSARYVPLDLRLTVCAAPDFLSAHVKAALLDTFSNRKLSGGRLGYFHPDSLQFGEDICLSGIVAAAQAVPGVASVEVDTFERLFEGKNQEIEDGVLPLGIDEIAQLDNDPNYPERGKLEIKVCGGR